MGLVFDMPGLNETSLYTIGILPKKWVPQKSNPKLDHHCFNAAWCESSHYLKRKWTTNTPENMRTSVQKKVPIPLQLNGQIGAYRVSSHRAEFSLSMD